MKNYVEDGVVITYINSGAAITAGSVVAIGNLLGVAVTDIAATTGTGAVKLSGVYSGMPKTTGSAWVAGTKLLWDVSAQKFDVATATPATGDILGAACVWLAAASGDTTGTVRFGNCNSTVT